MELLLFHHADGRVVVVVIAGVTVAVNFVEKGIRMVVVVRRAAAAARATGALGGRWWRETAKGGSGSGSGVRGRRRKLLRLLLLVVVDIAVTAIVEPQTSAVFVFGAALAGAALAVVVHCGFHGVVGLVVAVGVILVALQHPLRVIGPFLLELFNGGGSSHGEPLHVARDGVLAVAQLLLQTLHGGVTGMGPHKAANGRGVVLVGANRATCVWVSAQDTLLYDTVGFSKASASGVGTNSTSSSCSTRGLDATDPKEQTTGDKAVPDTVLELNGAHAFLAVGIVQVRRLVGHLFGVGEAGEQAVVVHCGWDVRASEPAFLDDVQVNGSGMSIVVADVVVAGSLLILIVMVVHGVVHRFKRHCSSTGTRMSA